MKMFGKPLLFRSRRWWQGCHTLALQLSVAIWFGFMPESVRAESEGAPVPGLLQSWLQEQVGAQQKQTSSVSADQPVRFEIVLGTLDPRIKLAPCRKTSVYLPSNARLWGKTHVGLRCEQGAVKWNVFWPVTVKVWGSAFVAARNLELGQMLDVHDLKPGEVDLAESTSPVLTRIDDFVGRSVQRRVSQGQALRDSDLKARRWFSAGDPVRLRVTVQGSGFQALSEAKALANGDEGRCVRLKTAQGKIVCAQAVGLNQAEIVL